LTKFLFYGMETRKDFPLSGKIRSGVLGFSAGKSALTPWVAATDTYCKILPVTHRKYDLKSEVLFW